MIILFFLVCELMPKIFHFEHQGCVNFQKFQQSKPKLHLDSLFLPISDRFHLISSVIPENLFTCVICCKSEPNGSTRANAFTNCVEFFIFGPCASHMIVKVSRAEICFKANIKTFNA